ncbi:MAG: hypothetical protein Aurels2KO_16090 [Aureliella sp.]
MTLDSENNPYFPTAGADDVGADEKRSSCFKAYVWLNAMLALLLVLVPVALHLWAYSHSRDAVAPDGDPILNDSYYYIELNLPAVALYFGLPNAVCAWFCRKR